MKAKGDAHYLERQPEWLKEIVPNTTVRREYGIHRSAQKMIDYLQNSMNTQQRYPMSDSRRRHPAIRHRRRALGAGPPLA